MAAKIATLAINIVSKHAKAVKGMKAVGKQAQRTKTTFSSLAGALGPVAAGFFSVSTAINAAKTVWAKLNEAFTEMDAIGKMSDRIGIGIDALVALRHAADQTGAGAETLNAGLMTMAKRLGEAARGAGAAKPALEYLGLSAQRLVAMSPDQSFIEIAEAISKVADQQQRAALTANIFSKGNMELLNTLEAGKTGLAEYYDEAERLKLFFTDEDKEKVYAYNDAMDRLNKSFKGMAREWGPGVATVLERLIVLFEKLVEWIDKFNVKWENLGPTGRVMRAIGDPFSALVGASSELADAEIRGRKMREKAQAQEDKKKEEKLIAAEAKRQTKLQEEAARQRRENAELFREMMEARFDNEITIEVGTI